MFIIFFFTGHDASNNIGSPTQMMNVGDLHEQFQMKKEQNSGVSIKIIIYLYVISKNNFKNIYIKKKCLMFTADTTFSSNYSINWT